MSEQSGTTPHRNTQNPYPKPYLRTVYNDHHKADLNDGGALLHPAKYSKGGLGLHDVDGQPVPSKTAGFRQQQSQTGTLQPVNRLTLFAKARCAARRRERKTRRAGTN